MCEGFFYSVRGFQKPFFLFFIYACISTSFTDSLIFTMYSFLNAIFLFATVIALGTISHRQVSHLTISYVNAYISARRMFSDNIIAADYTVLQAIN